MRLDRPVVVAGGGIGGLTAALALHARGLPVEVYERRTAEQIRTAPGSGLTIWSNAATPLGWLGLGERLLAAGERVVAIHSFDSRGRVRFRMPTHPYLAPGALPSLSIGRMDLAETLMSACAERGIDVHYGQRVTGYRDGAAGPEIMLDGGSVVRAAALVGADGVRSTVLTRLHGAVPGIYLGRSTYRGVAPGAADLVPEVPQLFHDAATGVGGGVYPIGGDRAAWTLSLRAPAGEHDEPARALELARRLPPVVHDRVARTPADAVIRTDIWYHEWHERWGEGRVTLLGDAAHALPNDLGQGACQAVEDAVVLADALAGAADVESGLRAYERRRFDRVRWVRQQSVQVATAPEPSGPVARWLMTRAFRVFMAAAGPKLWREMQRPPRVSDVGAVVA